ncbi:MAG: thiamine pyrophosphate-binding protein [Candidatus Latescibacterota bacterium]|jgi:acetolactate synthase-1/2/3 large subunit
MTGAELFAASLRVQGVEWVSTLCGNGLNDLLAACEGTGIRVVDTRNEQAAAYMADAWGKLSGRPGVCLVSSGVAHVNALGGVTNAWFDGAPMLLVSGAGPLRTAGLGHFQDLDQVTLAAPVCKYARLIDSAPRVAEFVHQAFAAALHGRPGPAHLTFPMDVQAASAEGAEPWPRVVRVRGGRAAPELVERLAGLLAASRRPLIVCGSGAYHAGAEQALAQFSAAFGVPVVVPIWDRGAIPAGMTEYVGVVGAATGDPALLGEADLVLLLGAEVDYRVGHLASPPLRPGTPVVQIDADPARLGRCLAPALEIGADPGALLTDLQEACMARRLEGFEEWLTEAKARREAFTRAVVDGASRGDGQVLHALDILEVLERLLPADAVLIVDGGNLGQWFHHTLGSRQYPGHWLTCGASAVIGFGLPAAMAARVGFPRRPVVVLSGDGSATFTVAELERATGQGLPFVFIVADDERWGIVETGQARRFGRPLNSLLGPVDFAGLARALGALGARGENRAELEAALRQGLNERLPAVIHVPVVGGMPVA